MSICPIKLKEKTICDTCQDYEDDDDDDGDDELKQRGELTEADVEAMFEGAEDQDYSVDHQDDDEEGVEYEEIIIRDEPRPKVAGATMRFG